MLSTTTAAAAVAATTTTTTTTHIIPGEEFQDVSHVPNGMSLVFANAAVWTILKRIEN